MTADSIVAILKTVRDIIYGIGIVVALYGTITGDFSKDQISKIADWYAKNEVGIAQRGIQVAPPGAKP